MDELPKRPVRCALHGYDFSGNLGSKVVVASIICFRSAMPAGSRGTNTRARIRRV